MNRIKTLRARYFFWLTVLTGVIFIAFVSLLLIFNCVEYLDHRELGKEEFLESVILVGITALMFPFLLAFAWRISGRLLHPIQEIIQSAQRIRSGDLDHRIPTGVEGDELAQLAQTINDAFARHQEAVQRLDRFSADVSHQLRNPLSAIRTAAQISLTKERDPEIYRSTLSDVLEEVDRLECVIEQLLTLARLSREDASRAFGPVNFGALFAAITDEYKLICDDRRIALETCAAANLPDLRGNPLLLKEALSNLLNNALRHTPDGGHIALLAQQEMPDTVTIRIEDSGPGIPEALKARLFQRFQRGAVNPADGGAGLGLAIVREIALVHGGDITLGESRWGGAAFVLLLPERSRRGAYPLSLPVYFGVHQEQLRYLSAS